MSNKSIGSKRWFKVTRNILMITLGCAIYAVAFSWFYQPNEISAGGFVGISQIINFYFPVIPIGVVTAVLNIPLFILGIRKQGFRLLISSLYSMLMVSLFIDLIALFHTFEPMQDRLLAAGFGGVIAGLGIGILMKYGTTTGGTELCAKLLKYKFPHISVGKLCLVIDIVIVIAYTIAFRNVYNALYGIASMYLFSISVDFVVYGGNHAKIAYIISDKNDIIKKMLLDLNLGLTVIDAHGGWKNDDKKLILCAFKRNQIAVIKRRVNRIDPDAFTARPPLRSGPRPGDR